MLCSSNENVYASAHTLHRFGDNTAEIFRFFFSVKWIITQQTCHSVHLAGSKSSQFAFSQNSVLWKVAVVKRVSWQTNHLCGVKLAYFTG